MTASAGAQIQFAWPESGVNPSHYMHPEECLALAWRVSDSVRRAQPVWRDTVRWNPAVSRGAYSAAVQAATRTCAEKFRAEAFDVRNISTVNTLIQLYLFGQQDHEASVLASRALAAIPTDSVERQLDAIETFALSYLQAQPIRFASADTLVSLFLSRTNGDMTGLRQLSLRKLSLRLEQFDASERVGALDAAREYAADAMAINRSLTTEDRSTRLYRMRLQRDVVDANNFLLREELPARIKRGTKHYVQWKAEQFGRISGVRLSDIQAGLAEPIATLVADYWFGQRESDTEATDVACEPALPGTEGDSTRRKYPQPGRNTLVVFLSPQFCMEKQTCWGVFASLRRLAQEFPSLNVIFVAKTRGFFGAMEPPAPSVEAGAMCGYLLGFHRLPGVLAVSNTSFMRLPAPDRRRINEETENVRNYSYESMFGVGERVGYYLADKEGLLVHAREGFDRSDEDQLRQLISSLETR